MYDPCNAKNYVPPQAVWRWNFFRWMIPVLLAALLLGLIGLERQYARIETPIIETGPPAATRLSGSGQAGTMVDIQLDGRSVGQTTINSAGVWMLDTSTVEETGDHQFVAVALDPEGNHRSQSNAWDFRIGEAVADNESEYEIPTLTVARSENRFVLSGSASPGTTVELFDNGNFAGFADVGDDGRWSMETTTQPYGNRFVARGVAPDGGTIGESEAVGYASAALTVGAVALTDKIYTWRGSAEPGAIVTVLQDGEQMGTAQADTDGNWSFEGATDDLTAGEYVLSANILGQNGVVLAMADDETMLSIPTSGLTTNAAELAKDGTTFTWDGSGEPGTEIEILLDGEGIGRTTVDDDGNWSFESSTADLADGRHELLIQRLNTDGQLEGEPSVPTSLTIGDDTTARLADNELAVDEDAALFTWSGTGEPGAEVVILLDEAEIGRTTIDPDGNWLFEGSIADLTTGDYALVAQIQDESGDTSTATTLDIGETESADITGQLQVVVGDAEAEAGEAGTAPTGAPSVALILDASWSMTFGIDYTGEDVGENADESQRLTADDPNSRIAVAKAGLIDFIENSMLTGTPASLRIFGDRQGDFQCQTNLTVAYGTLNKTDMIEGLRGAQPAFNANTTIARSLELAPDDLAGSAPNNRNIVLITDGDETCGGDPEAVITTLANQGFNISVNIIGFSINDDALKNKLEGWAKAGNGEFFDASDSASLVTSLQSAFAVRYIVRDVDGDEAASGKVGGAPLQLPIGNYSVVLLTNPAQSFDVEIVAEETTIVTTE